MKHMYVLPVLLLVFCALSLTRAVIPSLLIQSFGDNIYFIMGCAECVRGLLAFLSCPAFGKISDIVGRKSCLFVTVLGTCVPVCSLAVMSLQGLELTAEEQTHRMWIFIVLLSLSGIFSSTFTLTFAYISDTVKNKKDRVTAYGLALATFGLSFTIGPMAGGYLAHVEVPSDMIDESGGMGDGLDEMNTLSNNIYYLHPIGQRRVFCTSFILTVLDLLYIYFILPESVSDIDTPRSLPGSPRRRREDDEQSIMTEGTHTSFSDQWNHLRNDVLPRAWSPMDALKLFTKDPFMKEVGLIAFLYYTSLWAVVSTLTLYATKRFAMSPERLGELMSALGLSTMISEVVLVRLVVPSIGEKRSMRVGLAAFALQCIVLGLANEGWQLFFCVLLSCVANLVYPSLTSLVSNAVASEMVGEALGAVNGVKALTEGVGPLMFGTLLTFSEKTPLPGWPYLLASLFALAAYKRAYNLPDDDDDDDDYISERYYDRDGESSSFMENLSKIVSGNSKNAPVSALSEIEVHNSKCDDEYLGLLSEVDEIDEDEVIRVNRSIAS